MGLIADGLKKINSITDPLCRNFTTSEEERLVKIANDVDDSDDWFAQNVTDRFARWLDKNGWLEFITDSNTYQQMVIDCYNLNFEVIRKIFDNCRALDSDFGGNIESYNKQSYTGLLLLKNLAERINPDSTQYDISVSDRIDGFSTGWLYTDRESLRISDLRQQLSTSFSNHQPHAYSDEEIVSFCNQADFTDVFSDYSDYIYLEELDYGTLEDVGVIVFMGVEITKDEITSIMTGEGFEEKQARENLSDLINSIISAEDPCEGFLKDHEYAKECVLKYIDWYKKSDKEAFEEEFPNYEYSDWEKFVQFAGGIDVITEMAEKCPQYVDYLFNDYSEGLKIINSLDALCGDNISPEMKSAIETLRKDYSDKWDGMINKLWDGGMEFAAGQGQDAIKKWVQDNIPALSTLQSILEITGGQEVTEAYSKLLSLQNIANDTRTAFEAAVAKVQSGDYTSDDLDTVENLFNLLKQTHITIYETYRDMCIENPMKQVYANEQIERLNKMTMENYDNYPRQSYYFE